jgi:hypothetical protein
MRLYIRRHFNRTEKVLLIASPAVGLLAVASLFVEPLMLRAGLIFGLIGACTVLAHLQGREDEKA